MTSITQDNTALTLAPFRNLSVEGLDRIRKMYAEMTPTRNALALLFELDAAQTAPSEQWVGFFIEVSTAQLIWDERPSGVLTEGDASWVLTRFDAAPTLSVLAVLVRLLDEAHSTPVWFEGAVRKRAAAFRSNSEGGIPAAKRSAKHLRLVA